MPISTDAAKALRHAYKSAEGNGHDFGFVEDIVKHMKRTHKAQAVGAFVTLFQKHGIMQVHEPVTTDSGTYTQFTWDVPPSVVLESLDRMEFPDVWDTPGATAQMKRYIRNADKRSPRIKRP